MILRFLPLAGMVVLALANRAMAQTPAADRAAQRVKQILMPSTRPAMVVDGPVPWQGGMTVGPVVLPLVPYVGAPPQPPVPPRKPVLPHAVSEGQPPIAVHATPSIVLPTKLAVQLPVADLSTPLPIPVLGQPVPERAALDDVTLEASVAAGLGRVRPRRTGPVPFVPVNLPDPFENQRLGGLHEPPAEIAQPPAVPIRTPVK